jgi:hypothetical protein
MWFLFGMGTGVTITLVAFIVFLAINNHRADSLSAKHAERTRKEDNGEYDAGAHERRYP